MKPLVRVFITAVLSGILFTTCSNKSTEAEKLKLDSLNLKIQTLTASQNLQEANKKMVADFYQELFGDKDVNAIDKYIGETYIQHNPSLPDGRDALKKAAAQWFKGLPREKIDIRHLGADGDFVYIHTKSNRGDASISVMDIFRIENGKIVEHWDILQEVPKKSANPHPMF